MQNKAIIIGSGLTALQAAIELADLGVKVSLISNQNSLGGNAKNLYKAFPTDDCFYCISSIKEKCGIRKCFYRAGIWEHPNIIVYLDSRISKIEGKIGNFKIAIKQKPQYIDHNKCIQCGECERICPILIDIDEMGRYRGCSYNSLILGFLSALDGKRKRPGRYMLELCPEKRYLESISNRNR